MNSFRKITQILGLSSILLCSTSVFSQDKLGIEKTAFDSYKRVDAKDGVRWKTSPKLSYETSELKGEPRQIILKLKVNKTGIIRSIKVIKSTGIPELDKKVIKFVRIAQFQPYKSAFTVMQPLDLSL